MPSLHQIDPVRTVRMSRQAALYSVTDFKTTPLKAGIPSYQPPADINLISYFPVLLQRWSSVLFLFTMASVVKVFNQVNSGPIRCRKENKLLMVFLARGWDWNWCTGFDCDPLRKAMMRARLGADLGRQGGKRKSLKTSQVSGKIWQ